MGCCSSQPGGAGGGAARGGGVAPAARRGPAAEKQQQGGGAAAPGGRVDNAGSSGGNGGADAGSPTARSGSENPLGCHSLARGGHHAGTPTHLRYDESVRTTLTASTYTQSRTIHSTAVCGTDAATDTLVEGVGSQGPHINTPSLPSPDAGGTVVSPLACGKGGKAAKAALSPPADNTESGAAEAVGGGHHHPHTRRRQQQHRRAAEEDGGGGAAAADAAAPGGASEAPHGCPPAAPPAAAGGGEGGGGSDTASLPAAAAAGGSGVVQQQQQRQHPRSASLDVDSQGGCFPQSPSQAPRQAGCVGQLGSAAGVSARGPSAIRRGESCASAGVTEGTSYNTGGSSDFADADADADALVFPETATIADATDRPDGEDDTEGFDSPPVEPTPEPSKVRKAGLVVTSAVRLMFGEETDARRAIEAASLKVKKREVLHLTMAVYDCEKEPAVFRSNTCGPFSGHGGSFVQTPLLMPATPGGGGRRAHGASLSPMPRIRRAESATVELTPAAPRSPATPAARPVKKLTVKDTKTEGIRASKPIPKNSKKRVTQRWLFQSLGLAVPAGLSKHRKLGDGSSDEGSGEEGGEAPEDVPSAAERCNDATDQFESPRDDNPATCDSD